MRQGCDTCRRWREGDPSPKGIGNVGVCVALMTPTPGFYDKNPAAPFWAQKLAHLTTSYEGQGCPTYQAKGEQ